MFSVLVNHVSLPGSVVDDSVFGGCLDNITYCNVSVNCKFWWWRNDGLGLGPLVPLKAAIAYKHILHHYMLIQLNTFGMS